MARWAMVDGNGYVANVIEWDGNEDTSAGGWEIPRGVVMVEEGEATEQALIGGRWDGTMFSPPEYDASGQVIIPATRSD